VPRRELDYPLELIEVALADLAANDLVVLYQVGRHRYYSLTRWGQWQSLSLAKITPSKYPAPPSKGEGIPPAETEKPSETPAQHFPAFPRVKVKVKSANPHTMWSPFHPVVETAPPAPTRKRCLIKHDLMLNIPHRRQPRSCTCR